MKAAKLLNILSDFLDGEKRAQRKQAECIKKVLKKLKKKERAMKAKLSSEKSANRQKRLAEELQVIYAQRKKGVSILKGLKKV